MLAAKKDYKYYCRSCKLKFNYAQGQKMNEMRRKQPREFWKMFKPKKKSQKEEEVSTQNFHQYFQSLASNENAFENADITEFIQKFYSSRTDSTFCEYDRGN